MLLQSYRGSLWCILCSDSLIGTIGVRHGLRRFTCSGSECLFSKFIV
jgi:hypothetical protein